MRIISRWTFVSLVATSTLLARTASAFDPINGTGAGETICLFNTAGGVPKWCIDSADAQDFTGTPEAVSVNAGSGDDNVILRDAGCTCTCTGFSAWYAFSLPYDVVINGEGGEDLLLGANAATGAITWNGGTEDDIISTGNQGSGNETINGGDGNDVITKYGAGAPFTLNAGAGSDTVGLDPAGAANYCQLGITCHLGENAGDNDVSDCNNGFPLFLYCDEWEGVGDSAPICSIDDEAPICV